MPSASSDLIDRYVDALCRDIRGFCLPTDCEYLPADTVYFGGGTPTLLTVPHFEKILFAISERFGIADGTEITSECNPGTADQTNLLGMRQAGINRLSIGLQSIHENELRALGRIHDFDDFKRVFSLARRSGFDNISLDLMYGIPKQTVESFERTLDEVVLISPEHISAYCLKIEENTPFYKMKEKLPLPDEDTVCDMYENMVSRLADNGYNAYEISNFARSGRESRHNLKYWTYDDYIGFGAAAHSFIGGVRIENSRDVLRYSDGEDICVSRMEISKREAMNEYVMLGMRLSRGVDVCEFESRFGESFEENFGRDLRKYGPTFVTAREGRYFFTERGRLVSNAILSDVLDFDE